MKKVIGFSWNRLQISTFQFKAIKLSLLIIKIIILILHTCDL